MTAETSPDCPTALRTQVDLDRSTVEAGAIDLTEIAVGVDSPGIVVFGRDAAGHLYVLDDLSGVGVR